MYLLQSFPIRDGHRLYQDTIQFLPHERIVFCSEAKETHSGARLARSSYSIYSVCRDSTKGHPLHFRSLITFAVNKSYLFCTTSMHLVLLLLFAHSDLEIFRAQGRFLKTVRF